MAARALAAVAGRRIVAGQTGAPLLASFRRGAQNHSSSAQPEQQNAVHDDGAAAAATVTAAQVEAALNRKNDTVLPDEAVDALEGEAGEDAWVPDQETGVFVPADEAADADSVTAGAPPAPPHPPGTAAAGGSASVLDQTVFVREEDMEDIERPATDMATPMPTRNKHMP